MTDAQARDLSGRAASPLSCSVSSLAVSPVAGLLAPLAHASSTVLNVVAALLAAALVGAYVALAVLRARAVLLIVGVLRVVRPHLDGHR